MDAHVNHADGRPEVVDQFRARLEKMWASPRIGSFALSQAVELTVRTHENGHVELFKADRFNAMPAVAAGKALPPGRLLMMRAGRTRPISAVAVAGEGGLVAWSILDVNDSLVATSGSAGLHADWTPDDSNLLYFCSAEGPDRGVRRLTSSRPGADEQIFAVDSRESVAELQVDQPSRTLAFNLYRNHGRRELVLASIHSDGGITAVCRIPGGWHFAGMMDRFACLWRVGGSAGASLRLVPRVGDEWQSWRGGELPLDSVPCDVLVRGNFLVVLARVRLARLCRLYRLEESGPFSSWRLQRASEVQVDEGIASRVMAGSRKEAFIVSSSALHRRDRHYEVDVGKPESRRELFYGDPLALESGFSTVELEAKSSDGTMIPYLSTGLEGRREIATGFPASRATILIAYGGFGEMTYHRFRFAWRAWLDAGGRLAAACPRGSGDLGASWHSEGKGRCKERTFEDVAAVSHDLVRRGLCSVGPVGFGSSNGALTIAATAVRFPDAFSAIALEDALLDMEQYVDLNPENYWLSEFGDPREPKDLRVIRRWSPLSNLRKGMTICPIRLSAGRVDPVVNPNHTFRFVERLHELGLQDRVVLSVKPRGHALNPSPAQLRTDRAEVLAFAFKHGFGPVDRDMAVGT